MLTSSSWIGSMIPCFPLDILLVSESVLLIFWSSSKLPNPFSSFLVPSSVSSASKRIRAIYIKWSLVWIYKDHRKQKTRKTLFRPVTSYHHFWNLSLLKMKKNFKSFCCWKSWESQIKTWIFDRNCTKQGPQVSLLWISIVSIFPLINPPEFFFFTEHRKIHHLIYIIWHTHNYVFCNKH